MTNGSVPFVRSACCAVLGCIGLGVSLWALLGREAPSLAAANNYSGYDQDRDGLSDAQELQIGTLPTRADTDQDGYSDLEECARNSDPTSAGSVPSDQTCDIASYASQENGYVTVVAAMFVDGAPLTDFQLHFGVVYRGMVLRFAPRDFQYTRARLLPGRDARDALATVELGIPVDLVRRLGNLNLFAYLRGTGANAPEPVLSVISLAEQSGVVLSIHPRRFGITNSGTDASGIVYRPLAGDDQIPATFSSGKVCLQRTSAVGMHGVSVTYEVTGADCIPMDTFCSGGDCSGAVGTTLELPDPGALIGG